MKTLGTKACYFSFILLIGCQSQVNYPQEPSVLVSHAKPLSMEEVFHLEDDEKFSSFPIHKTRDLEFEYSVWGLENSDLVYIIKIRISTGEPIGVFGPFHIKQVVIPPEVIPRTDKDGEGTSPTPRKH